MGEGRGLAGARTVVVILHHLFDIHKHRYNAIFYHFKVFDKLYITLSVARISNAWINDCPEVT